MDPLSATASVAALLVTCGKVARVALGVCGTYKDAPFTIDSIATECAAVRAALDCLQSLLGDDTDSLDVEISHKFETAILGCTSILSALEEYVIELRKNQDLSNLDATSRRAKLKLLWHERKIKELLLQLQGHKSSITMLVNVLQRSVTPHISVSG